MHEEREPEVARGVAVQHVLDGDEVLEGLGHFAAGDGEVPGVEEVADPVVVVVEGLYKKEINKTSSKLDFILMYL